MRFARHDNTGWYKIAPRFQTDVIRIPTGIRVWMSNYIHDFFYVITYPCSNLNGCLKLPLKLEHGWVITSYFLTWMLLHVYIDALNAMLVWLISVNKKGTGFHLRCRKDENDPNTTNKL